MATLSIPSSILVVGDRQIVNGVACCLARCGSKVTLYTTQQRENQDKITACLRQMEDHGLIKPNFNGISVVDKWPKEKFDIVFILNENIQIELITKLEKEQPKDTIIALSCDGTPLDQKQRQATRPHNLVGVNWTEPAHTTFFFEIVKSLDTDVEVSSKIKTLAEIYWQKDPYIVEGTLGIRAKLVSALIREAFHIVEEGYASVKDIDRACRNDGGTYLPFTGNFRYMDLMGTYAYAVVMEDLNKELSNKRSLPNFYESLIDQNKLGQKTGEGFYKYHGAENQKLLKIFDSFSYKIRELMLKHNRPKINTD